MERLVRWFVAGQVLFLAMMAVCWVIEPSRTAVKRGLSFYGNDPRTVAPYTAGFVLAIGLTAVGLRRHRSGRRRLRWAVAALAALMIPIPLTPYRADIVVDWLHIGSTTVLFLAGLLVGGWLAIWHLRRHTARALFGFQALAGFAVLAAQVGLHRYMIPSQIVFQLLVVALVVPAMRRTAPAAPAPA